jgi:hypothetical protein
LNSDSILYEPIDPLADRDGYGQANAAEQSAGTNPLDAVSVLKATAIARSGNDLLITIATVPGKFYQLQTSTTLAEDDWDDIGLSVQAIGSSTVFTHPGGAGDPRRFHRVKVIAE